MPRRATPSEDYETGYDQGSQDTLNALQGFMKMWEQAVGEELDPLVAAQLAEHKTAPILISILAEYQSIWRGVKLQELKDLIIDEYIRPARTELLALQKLIVQLPTVLEKPPKDPGERDKYMAEGRRLGVNLDV